MNRQPIARPDDSVGTESARPGSSVLMREAVPAWLSWALPAVPACLLVGLVLFLYSALLTAAGFESHESTALYLRAVQYLQELRLGHFPPRLFPTELAGAGYPAPLLYPPLGPWLAAGCSALVNDVVIGTHLALLLLVAASGLAFYWAALSCGASRWLALGCAAVYVAAPYRFIDVFVRGALAESGVFVWFPLIVAAALGVVRQRRFSILLAVAVGGLLLTHAVVAMYFTLFCLPLAAVALRGRWVRPVFLLLAGIALGGALSAWHHLPAQSLIPSLRLSDPFEMWASTPQVLRHAIPSNQLLNAVPGRWFGYSPSDLSFPVGLAPALALLVAAAFCVLDHYRNRRWTPVGLHTAMALVSVAACMLFVMAPGPGLAILPSAFNYIQFPWRVLGPAVFFTAFAPVLAGPAMSPKTQKVAGVVLLFASLLIPAWQRSSRVREDWTGKDTRTIRTLEGAPPIALTIGEYLPAGVTTEQLTAALAAAPQVISGSATLAMTRTRDGVGLHGQAHGPAEVRLPLLALLPLWHALDAAGHEPSLRASSGLLAVALPPGPVAVQVTRRTMPVEHAGRILSALSLGVLLALGWRRIRRPAADAQGGGGSRSR